LILTVKVFYQQFEKIIKFYCGGGFGYRLFICENHKTIENNIINI